MCSVVCILICSDVFYFYFINVFSAGFRGGPKGPPTMFMCLRISATCVCHLVIFISEESLFVDPIKLSVVQTAVFHLYII